MSLRRNLMKQAIDECFTEMYSKAQPKADYAALIQGKLDGTIEDTDENPIYRRYYLSYEEFKYIRDKYVEKYRFKNEWESDIDFLKECLTNGGYRDVYINKANETPHRSAEKTETLKELIGEENATKVIKVIDQLERFYRFDREEGDFSCAVALGASPSSNKESVEKYWREHGMPDFTIEERDPESFWYRDEYGNDWEKVLNDELNDYESEGYEESSDSEN